MWSGCYALFLPGKKLTLFSVLYFFEYFPSDDAMEHCLSVGVFLSCGPANTAGVFTSGVANHAPRSLSKCWFSAGQW
ncbi:hypothetical protein ACT691_17005 [Vibrio metschnikovii]